MNRTHCAILATLLLSSAALAGSVESNRFGETVDGLQFACNLLCHYEAGMVGDFDSERWALNRRP